MASIHFMGSARTQIIAVGANTVSAAVFRRTRHRELVLEQLATVAHRDSPPACVASLTGKLGLRGNVRLVVPGYFTLTKIVKTPAIARSRLGRIADFEASQNIPSAMGEVTWDYAQVGNDAGTVDLMIVAAKVERIAEWSDAAASAGLCVLAVSPASTALLRGFQINQPGVAGVVLVNVGPRCTEVIVVHHTHHYFRTLPMTTTTPVKNAARTDIGTAESISNAADSFEADGAQTELFATKLAVEVARTIANVRTQTAFAPVAVHLAGQASLIPAVTRAFEATLKIPVVRYTPLTGVTVPANAGMTQDAAQNPLMPELVGAAATELLRDRGLIELNLLPRHEREFEIEGQRQFWWLVAATAAVIGLLVSSWHYHHAATRARAELASIERTVLAVTQQAERNAANLERLADTQRTIRTLEKFADARTAWVRFLGDLQDRIAVGDDVWLEKLNLAPPPLPNPPAAAPPQTPTPATRVLLSGWVLNQPRVGKKPTGARRIQALLVSLAQSPYVNGIENEHFDAATPGVLRFELTLVASTASNL